MTEDNLALLYKHQADLQARLGYDFAAMSGPEIVTYVKDMVLALEDELHEALQECQGWKPWTAGDRYINRRDYQGELIDAMHFLFNLFLVIGTSTQEIVDLYLVKNKRNFERQDEGYDGTDKCAHCGREHDGDHSPGVLMYGKKFCDERCFDLWKANQE